MPYFLRRRPVTGSAGFAGEVQPTVPVVAPNRYDIRPAGAVTVPCWYVMVVSRRLGSGSMEVTCRCCKESGLKLCPWQQHDPWGHSDYPREQLHREAIHERTTATDAAHQEMVGNPDGPTRMVTSTPRGVALVRIVADLPFLSLLATAKSHSTPMESRFQPPKTSA